MIHCIAAIIGGLSTCSIKFPTDLNDPSEIWGHPYWFFAAVRAGVNRDYRPMNKIFSDVIY
jgi:hypothetical protein